MVAPVIDTQVAGDRLASYIARVVFGFTTVSDDPTTNRAGTVTDRAAVVADGLVSAAASTATVSML